MARSAAPDAVEAIQRQLRRVRRRRNLRELQRAIYLLIAVVAAAMAGLVLLALRASPGAFAEGAVAAGSIALFAAVGVLWRGHRRWVARQGAPRWIDRETRLGGRLVTLVEIHRRGEVAAPLFPLLVEQNVARLSVWHPDRVVPRRVPRGALAAAGSAVALLGIVVALGPRLVPPPVVGAERPPGGIEPVDLTADRLALAPANGDDDATETSNEESAAARLQRGIRRALAPAPTEEPPGSGGAAASDGGAEEARPAPPAAAPPAGLAPGRRAAAAMPRMPVPAAYEAVVRALFARESPP